MQYELKSLHFESEGKHRNLAINWLYRLYNKLRMVILFDYTYSMAIFCVKCITKFTQAWWNGSYGTNNAIKPKCNTALATTQSLDMKTDNYIRTTTTSLCILIHKITKVSFRFVYFMELHWSFFINHNFATLQVVMTKLPLGLLLF